MNTKQTLNDINENIKDICNEFIKNQNTIVTQNEVNDKIIEYLQDINMERHIKIINDFENKLIYILPSDSIGEKFLYGNTN